jgi:outer membrane protein assembly factor BamB
MIARIRIRARLSLLLLAVASAAVVPTRASGQSCLAGTAADEFTADAAGLTREWILQLPFVASGYRLDQVVAGDGLVVAQTSDGTVHAVQAAPWGEASPAAGAPRPGSLLWSQRVGTDGSPITRAGIGPDIVVVPHGQGIAGLERTTGYPRWQEPFNQTASGGAAVIGNWAYVPGSAGTVNRFAVNPLRQPVESTTADDKRAATKTGKKAAKKTKTKQPRQESLAPIKLHAGGSGRVEMAATPLAAGVLWCTSDGLLVTLQPGELDWRKLEFSLENPPAGSPVVRDRSVFASTTSGDLARIELPPSNKELQLAWHTVLPGPAFSGPFLSGDTVVVSLGDLGIAAYAAETGSELWQTCLTGTILAVGGGRVWVIDELGKLSAFDLADGTPRERLCLGPFTLPVVNTHSEQLLLASPSGMLVSLAPRATGTPTPADASDAAATSPAAPARVPSDPAATLRP